MSIYAPLTSEPVPLLQQIEVATFFQIPSFHIIGLPSPEVAEARERVRSAFEASELQFPKRRVIVNLSPASIRKRGTGVDLAIALSILNKPNSAPQKWVAWGELGLDGIVKPCGQLTRSLYAAWQAKIEKFILSELEYSEALQTIQKIQSVARFSNLEPPPDIIPVRTLGEAWNLLKKPKKQGLKKLKENEDVSNDSSKLVEVSQVVTDPNKMESADVNPLSPPGERVFAALSLLPLTPALERIIGISVSGKHHLLLLGPKGVGKTQALEWVLALQPPNSSEDWLRQSLIAELAENAVHNSSGLRKGIETKSLVRRVSSHVRPAALIGGANVAAIYPGEFSLAHGGVLLADELPEWSRDSREALREPLERGRITLTRSKGVLEMPAQFQLIATGNFCPCGGVPPQYPSSHQGGRASDSRALLRCRCTQSVRENYVSKLSGPILDRFDIVSVLVQDYSSNRTIGIEYLEELQRKVIRVRKSLEEAWGALPGLLTGYEVEKWIQAHSEWGEILNELPLGSLRSRHKTVRLALSLAAWDGQSKPDKTHFIEANEYRAGQLSIFN